MRLPRWVTFLLGRLAPGDRSEDLLGDLAEVHRARVQRRGATIAYLLTSVEALETALALLVLRVRPRSRAARGSSDVGGAPIGSGRAPLFSLLDLKLGARMIARYPGLTAVGGLAMAFAIWVGIGGFQFYTQMIHPTLPLEDGHEIVGITVIDDVTGDNEFGILREFGVWRSELTSVVELAAYQGIRPNLVVEGDRGAPISGAAVTASVFSISRVPPLHGRVLVPSDETPGAPLAVVIGYDAWHARFGADPGVVGQVVRVGNESGTVVGVMPPDFGFPINQSLWTALRSDPASVAPRTGPQVRVVGRLAPGASMDQAQTEVTALLRRAAGPNPVEYEHLTPIVRAHAKSVFGLPPIAILAFGSINLGLLILLAIICGNVALLVFARAAGRESEIVVRTALGASRRRVVGQLFAESLVLGVISAGIGIAAAEIGLRWLWSAVQIALLDGTPLPFWIRPELTGTTLLYVAGLTLLAAAITGILPGLKITRGNMDHRLRSSTYGGGGLQFGAAWSGLIVLQIALMVSFPVVAWIVQLDARAIRTLEVGFDTERFLAAELQVRPAGAGDSQDVDALSIRFAALASEMEERLEAEPAIAGVTFASAAPGTYHDWRRIEMDAGGIAPRTSKDVEGPGRWMNGGRVSYDYFQVLGVKVLQGRDFRPEDAGPEARVVIVNQAFVDGVLGGRNPIGRRLRYLASGDSWDGVQLEDPPSEWYRIVGAVENVALTEANAERPGFYHAVARDDLRARWLLARVQDGEPADYVNRLRSIAAEVDPTLGLSRVMPLDNARDADLAFYAFWFWLVVGVSSVAMLVSLAGIFAVMSFTVARRTREIGVRVALGARPERIVAVIFRRPLLQAAGGVAVGTAFTAWVMGATSGDSFWGIHALITFGYGALMAAVCLTACIVPTWRALSIEPRDALGSDQ